MIPERVRGLDGVYPRVVTTARDLERRVLDFDGVLAAHGLYPGIPLGGGSERMPAAFFRISRCLLSRSFSCRSRSTCNCNASLPSGKPADPAALLA